MEELVDLLHMPLRPNASNSSIASVGGFWRRFTNWTIDRRPASGCAVTVLAAKLCGGRTSIDASASEAEFSMPDLVSAVTIASALPRIAACTTCASSASCRS